MAMALIVGKRANCVPSRRPGPFPRPQLKWPDAGELHCPRALTLCDNVGARAESQRGAAPGLAARGAAISLEPRRAWPRFKRRRCGVDQPVYRRLAPTDGSGTIVLVQGEESPCGRAPITRSAELSTGWSPHGLRSRGSIEGRWKGHGRLLERGVEASLPERWAAPGPTDHPRPTNHHTGVMSTPTTWAYHCPTGFSGGPSSGRVSAFSCINELRMQLAPLVELAVPRPVTGQPVLRA